MLKCSREQLREMTGAASVRSRIRERRLNLFWEWAIGPFEQRWNHDLDAQVQLDHFRKTKSHGFKPSLMAAIQPDGPFLTSCVCDLQVLAAQLERGGLTTTIGPTPGVDTSLDDWATFCRSTTKKEWQKITKNVLTFADEHIDVVQDNTAHGYQCDFCQDRFHRQVDKMSHTRKKHKKAMESAIEERVRASLRTLFADFPCTGCPSCGRPFEHTAGDPPPPLTHDQKHLRMHHIFHFNKKKEEKSFSMLQN